jgi:hypothetical protein
MPTSSDEDLALEQDDLFSEFQEEVGGDEGSQPPASNGHAQRRPAGEKRAAMQEEDEEEEAAFGMPTDPDNGPVLVFDPSMPDPEPPAMSRKSLFTPDTLFYVVPIIPTNNQDGRFICEGYESKNPHYEMLLAFWWFLFSDPSYQASRGSSEGPDLPLISIFLQRLPNKRNQDVTEAWLLHAAVEPNVASLTDRANELFSSDSHHKTIAQQCALIRQERQFYQDDTHVHNNWSYPITRFSGSKLVQALTVFLSPRKGSLEQMYAQQSLNGSRSVVFRNGTILDPALIFERQSVIRHLPLQIDVEACIGMIRADEELGFRIMDPSLFYCCPGDMMTAWLNIKHQILPPDRVRELDELDEFKAILEDGTEALAGEGDAAAGAEDEDDETADEAEGQLITGATRSELSDFDVKCIQGAAGTRAQLASFAFLKRRGFVWSGPKYEQMRNTKKLLSSLSPPKSWPAGSRYNSLQRVNLCFKTCLAKSSPFMFKERFLSENERRNQRFITHRIKNRLVFVRKNKKSLLARAARFGRRGVLAQQRPAASSAEKSDGATYDVRESFSLFHDIVQHEVWGVEGVHFWHTFVNDAEYVYGVWNSHMKLALLYNSLLGCFSDKMSNRAHLLLIGARGAGKSNNLILMDEFCPRDTTGNIISTIGKRNEDTKSKKSNSTFDENGKTLRKVGVVVRHEAPLRELGVAKDKKLGGTQTEESDAFKALLDNGYVHFTYLQLNAHHDKNKGQQSRQRIQGHSEVFETVHLATNETDMTMDQATVDRFVKVPYLIGGEQERPDYPLRAAVNSKANQARKAVANKYYANITSLSWLVAQCLRFGLLASPTLHISQEFLPRYYEEMDRAFSLNCFDSSRRQERTLEGIRTEFLRKSCSLVFSSPHSPLSPQNITSELLLQKLRTTHLDFFENSLGDLFFLNLRLLQGEHDVSDFVMAVSMFEPYNGNVFLMQQTLLVLALAGIPDPGTFQKSRAPPTASIAEQDLYDIGGEDGSSAAPPPPASSMQMSDDDEEGAFLLDHPITLQRMPASTSSPVASNAARDSKLLQAPFKWDDPGNMNPFSFQHRRGKRRLALGYWKIKAEWPDLSQESRQFVLSELDHRRETEQRYLQLVQLDRKRFETMNLIATKNGMDGEFIELDIKEINYGGNTDLFSICKQVYSGIPSGITKKYFSTHNTVREQMFISGLRSLEMCGAIRFAPSEHNIGRHGLYVQIKTLRALRCNPVLRSLQNILEHNGTMPRLLPCAATYIHPQKRTVDMDYLSLLPRKGVRAFLSKTAKTKYTRARLARGSSKKQRLGHDSDEEDGRHDPATEDKDARHKDLLPLDQDFHTYLWSRQCQKNHFDEQELRRIHVTNDVETEPCF